MNLEIEIIDKGTGRCAARTKRKQSEMPIILCRYCGEEADKHLKCKTCDILIHFTANECHCGVAHTHTLNGEECTSCENVRLHGIPEYDLKALSHLALTI